jgi:DNA-binding LytR/AlgR family response regulator
MKVINSGLEHGTCPANVIENEFFVKQIGKECRVRVKCADIVWIESNGNKSCIHLKNHDLRIEVSFNLQVFEKALPHETFVRIGRSEIINKNFICSYCGNSVRLENCLRSFTISKKHREEIFSSFVELRS